jgi:hypothetical protein
MNKILLSIIILSLLTPLALSLDCNFEGWDIIQTQSQTITLHGQSWIITLEQEGNFFIKRIIKEDINYPVEVDPLLTENEYLTIANDFLEANEDELDFEFIGGLSLLPIENPKTVEFTGETQTCANLPVLGTFAGALQFDEDEIIALVAQWYTPIILNDTLVEEIKNLQQSLPEGEQLAILPESNPKKKDFKIVTIPKNKTLTTVDAQPSILTDWEDPVQKEQEKKQNIILLIMIAVIILIFLFVGYRFFTKK